MAEYNKVMTQIKPDLPKVIDTEQIYVYVPKASYDQAGIMKPDRTQFAVDDDGHLSLRHIKYTDTNNDGIDDYGSVDILFGRENIQSQEYFVNVPEKAFVTKDNVIEYAVPSMSYDPSMEITETILPSDELYTYVFYGPAVADKTLKATSESTADTFALRDNDGALHAAMHNEPEADELVHYTYVSKNYLKSTAKSNVVYVTDASGNPAYKPYSNTATPDTVAVRQPDGSVHGSVNVPEDNTLLNNKYISEHYIPVGDDGKIPNSYLPADIGADEIVSGYYITGEFWDNFDAWEQENTWQINENPMTIFYDETETPMPYFKSYGSATIRTLSADNVLSGTVESSKMFQWMDDAQRLRFAKKNDENAGVACDVVQGAWSYKVSNDTTYQATDASAKQALRTIVFSRRPDDKTFLDWLKDNAVQTVGPTPVAGDPDKLYVDLNTNKTYRWEQYTGYVQVGSSLALGTTHESAYYGDFGDKAYKHSQAVGNPHNTQITDITGLKTKLDTIDTKLVKTLDDGNRNQYRIAMYAKQGTYGVVHTNRSDVSLNGTLQSGSFSISAGDVITMPGDNSIPIVNGVSLSSSNAEITLPLGMIVIADSDSHSFTSPSVWKITIRAATVADTLPIRVAPDNQALSIPLRDGRGRLTTITPSGNDDLHCVNIDYWKTNYKPFSYTTISTLSSVDKGFNVEYQIDGKSAEIEIPLEGTDDIVVDIDETNKMINIHLDAKVRAKLAKMLTLPAEAPAKNSIVGVGTNNAQMIMTEQEARDAISVYKTQSISQTDYDNLAVKDSKTLYLITG